MLVAGAGIWLTLNRPPAPRDHSGDLREFLVAAPVGSTPNPQVMGNGDQLNVGQVARLIGAEKPIEVLGVRRGVTDGWTEPNGTSVLVTLIQFDSDDAASWFLRTYCLRAQKRSGGESRDVSGLPGAQSFVHQARDDKDRVRVDAVAQRRDIVLLITEAQPGSVDVARVGTLVLSQYDRL